MDSFNIYMLSDILIPLPIDSLIMMLQINPYYHHFIQTSNHVTEWFWNEYFEYHEYLPEETNLKRALQLRGLHRWCPKKFDYQEFINLRSIDLFNNGISEIPESLFRLTNLIILSLEGNKISKIPESLLRLTNLKWLFLSNNQIREIPESLRHLPIHI